jgi:peptidyl-prolyl cis-trans isomerase D
MLTFFRRGGAGQVVLGTVVFAVILVFVMEFRPGRQGGAGISRDCAVKVFESCIDRKEFFAAYGLTVPRGITKKRLKALGINKALMDGFVERELLLKEADRLGISVSDEELDEELMAGRARVSLPVRELGYLGYQLGFSEDMVRLLPVHSVQDDQFDMKIYERVIRNYTNRSPKEFRDMQRRELIASRMRDLVKARVRVSEVEAYTQWERERSKAVARVVALDQSWFAKWAVDASDAAVDDWAKKNDKEVTTAWTQAQAGWKAECPVVSEIMVSVDEDAGDNTKTEKRQKIEAALERVKKGEAFDAVAKATSEGGTANLGGDIGCLNESYGPGAPELLEATKSLAPGKVSAVLETKRGFHVIKLVSRLKEKDVENVGKRFVAKRLAVSALAAGLAKEFGDKLIEKVKAGSKLDDATQELALDYSKASAPKAVAMMPGMAPTAKKQDAEPIAMQDPKHPRVEITAPFNVTGSPVEDADRSEAAAAKLFELAKVDEVVAKPIKTDSGYAVLQLKEKTLAKKEDFTKDRFQIMRALRTSKESDAVARYLAALRGKVKDKIVVDTHLLEESGAEDSSGDG